MHVHSELSAFSATVCGVAALDLDANLARDFSRIRVDADEIVDFRPDGVPFRNKWTALKILLVIFCGKLFCRRETPGLATGIGCHVKKFGGSESRYSWCHLFETKVSLVADLLYGALRAISTGARYASTFRGRPAQNLPKRSCILKITYVIS